MFGFHLVGLYEVCLAIGLTKSKRHFSRTFLGRHWTYLRDVQQRDRGGFRVPATTVVHVRMRLQEMVPYLSPGLRSEVDRLVAEIDQHTRVIRSLGYGRVSR